MNNHNQNKIKLITLAGVFAAIIFVVTLIHVPTGQGYTHAGDGVIYLASCLLPTPYAVAASAIGGALADGLSGAAIWMPATIIIKMVTALFFTSNSEKIVTPRNILGIIPSLAVCVLGYRLYEAQFILGGISAATLSVSFAQIPAYCVQVGVSTALYVIVGIVFDRIGLKKHFK